MRIDGATGRLSEYALDCAAITPTSETEALDRLVPISSLPWPRAKSIGDAATTGVYVFEGLESGVRYRGYISALTGRYLGFVVILAGGDSSSHDQLNWRPASELGTFCSPGAEQIAIALIPAEKPNLSEATGALFATGLMSALKASYLDVGPFVVTAVAPRPSAYLAFVTASRLGPAR